MTIRAVYLDLGGVIVRTEDRTPRTRLAVRFGMTYEQLESLVFGGDSSRKASIGAISTEEHWRNVAAALNWPVEQAGELTREFFDGDQVDYNLLDFIRSLRPGCRTGLISNAWPDLRGWIVSQGFGDVFDEMVISAEEGTMKPGKRIYQIALDRLNVPAEQAVFLDDMAVNVEAARSLGMQAIHFTQPGQALEELKELLKNPS